jgi:hypothetical protein
VLVHAQQPGTRLVTGIAGGVTLLVRGHDGARVEPAPYAMKVTERYRAEQARRGRRDRERRRPSPISGVAFAGIRPSGHAIKRWRRDAKRGTLAAWHGRPCSSSRTIAI